MVVELDGGGMVLAITLTPVVVVIALAPVVAELGRAGTVITVAFALAKVVDVTVVAETLATLLEPHALNTATTKSKEIPDILFISPLTL